jgi:hypothetical protein
VPTDHGEGMTSSTGTVTDIFDLTSGDTPSLKTGQLHPLANQPLEKNLSLKKVQMSRIKSRRFTAPKIVQSDAGPNLWLWSVLIIACALWTWQVYEYGGSNAQYAESRSASTFEELRERIAGLNAECDELRLQSARFERSGQIDREATQSVQGEIRALKNEIAALEREAAKLRDLVSDGDTYIEISDYTLLESTPGKRFQYRFTLSRDAPAPRKVEGEASIRVSGQLNGEPVELTQAELTDGSTKPHKLGFKHFQEIEGGLSLPAGFTPEALIIDVSPTGSHYKPFSRSFGWI